MLSDTIVKSKYRLNEELGRVLKCEKFTRTPKGSKREISQVTGPSLDSTTLESHHYDDTEEATPKTKREETFRFQYGDAPNLGASFLCW